MKKKVLTSLVIALALVGAFTVAAQAADTLKQINAYLNYGITVKYNGETQVLKGADGSTVYPITYDGTTYLPVRAISNLLGINVDWDGATQTVILGSKGATDLIETYKPYTKYASGMGGTDNVVFIQSGDNQTRDIGGITTNHWLAQRTYWAGGYQNMELITSFNIEGKYEKLTFKAYTDEDIKLTVEGDNDVVLGEFNLIGGQVPQTFTVDLRHTTQLTFHRAAKNDMIAVNAFVFDAILE